VVHRIDLPLNASSNRADVTPDTDERYAPARPVVIASFALIGISLTLMALSLAGLSDILPPGLRTLLVSIVALTLPGLPVAALMRLPLNGIFASVTIALSLACNILPSQLNIEVAPTHDYLVQAVILGGATAAVMILGRRIPDEASMSMPWRSVVDGLTTRGLPLLLLVGALALFALAVSRLDVDDAGRFGILQVLGVDYLAGLALLATVLALAYGRPVFDRVVAATANVVLIAYVTMPVAWATGTAPFPTAFAHRYIVNWIHQIHALPPDVDARMSWAGFFSASAHLMTISGLQDSEPFIASASLIFGILLAFPLYAIGMVITGDRRTAWSGVTVYVLFNWYQQDYFAPQAVAMQLYTTLIAVLLWQLRSSPLPALEGSRRQRYVSAWLRIPGRVAGRNARWTTALEMILVAIVAALVVGHQLTPLVTILALALFSAMGLTRYKLLWLAALMLFVAWFFYGAGGYWEGHLIEVLSDIGGLDGNLTSSVASRITGDPVYGQMQYLRMGASALLLGLAALGWLRLRHRGFAPIVAALAIAPLSLVLVQSYGGEVVIRSFLYASPLLAPLAAALLLPLAQSIRRHALSVAVCALAMLGCALLVVTNRGLNIAFEQTPRATYEIAVQIQDQTEDTKVGYWGQGLAFTVPLVFDPPEECFVDARTLADCTADSDISYLVNTKPDEKYLQYRYGFTPADVRQLVDILVTEKRFEVVYDDDGVRVLRRNDAPTLHIEGKQ
jgi:hypothetical protein